MYTSTIFLFSILPTALLLWVAFHEDQREAPSPALVIGIAMTAGYSLKGLYLAYASATGAYHRLNYASAGIVDLGVLATTFGTICFCAGYLILSRDFVRRKSPFTLPERNGIPPQILYWGLFALSLLLMVIYFLQMGFLEQVLALQFTAQKKFTLEGGQTTALGFLTFGGEFLIVFLLYYLVMAKRISFTHPIVLVILFCSLCWFLASRRNAVLILFALILLVASARIVKNQIVASLTRYAIIGAGVIILSFAALIRVGGSDKAVEDLSLIGALESTAEHVFVGSYFMDPAKTAVIIDSVPERVQHLYGRTYFEFVLTPIPRAIWPDKPDVRNSYFIADEILDLRTNSGVPPSGMAELYLNFGWGGIAIGMFIAGMLTYYVYRRFRNAADPRLARIPYACSILCIALFFLVDYTMAVLFFIRFQVAIYVASRYWVAREKKEALRHQRYVRQAAQPAGLPSLKPAP